MNSRNVTAELYNALREMLPGIPKTAKRLTLKLEAGEPPIVEVEYVVTDGGETPVETKSKAYAVYPVDDVFDVTCLSSRKRKKPTTDESIDEPQTLTVKVDIVAPEILKRQSLDTCNGVILDELRELRKELNRMSSHARVIGCRVRS